MAGKRSSTLRIANRASTTRTILPLSLAVSDMEDVVREINQYRAIIAAIAAGASDEETSLMLWGLHHHIETIYAKLDAAFDGLAKIASQAQRAA